MLDTAGKKITCKIHEFCHIPLNLCLDYPSSAPPHCALILENLHIKINLSGCHCLGLGSISFHGNHSYANIQLFIFDCLFKFHIE